MWPVAIAGGGIGGLACALALARQGFQSLVLEQAAEFGEAGVGLQMAPNALSVLDALGVGAAAKKHALLIERLLMMDAVTGDEVANIPLRRAIPASASAIPTRSRTVPTSTARCSTPAARSALIELRNGCRVLDFETSGNGVAVILEGGERIEAAALVGADGVHSNVRKTIVGDGDPPPAGAVIYRATIPAADMPKDLQQPYPTFWAGPGWHVIYYPMRDWSTFNLGCTVVTEPDAAERRRGGLAALRAAAVSPEAAPRRCACCASRNNSAATSSATASRWRTGPTGAVTLLGDAAHPMVQYIAQGAAMALEDAICLAGAAAECDGDFARAFQRYQDIRIVRTARVQISSLMMDRINHAKGLERKVRNSLFEGRTAEEFYDRLAWLYTPPPYVK